MILVYIEDKNNRFNFPATCVLLLGTIPGTAIYVCTLSLMPSYTIDNHLFT